MTHDSPSSQQAIGLGIAQAANGGTATVNITIAGGAATDSTLLQLIEKMGDQRDAVWQSKLETLTIQLSATQDAVEGFLVTMQRRGVSPDKYASTLQEIAADFHKLTAHRSLGGDFAPDVERLIDEANALLLKAKSELEYLAADDKLLQANTLVRSSIRERQLALAEAQKLLDQDKLESAKLSARRALVARVTLRYGDAAEHFVSAAEMIEETRFHEEEIEYYFEAGRALHMGGERQGDDALLRRGVDIFRHLIELCKKHGSSELAEAYVGLGGCLALIGERSANSKAELETALDAFRHVQSMQGIDPRLVSMTQNNIANVLFHLAKRLPPVEARVFLGAAMRELKTALSAVDKVSDPYGWGLVAFNKASQILDMKFDASDESASICAGEMELLDEVARIYASDEQLRPEWAAALVSQTNGHRYFIFYYFTRREIKEALRHANIAEDLLRQSQSVWTEAAFPRDWAMAEMNLGSIQSISSQITSDQGKATTAANTIKRAAAVYERLGDKVAWAQTQHNLGLHYFTNGAWAENPELYNEAVQALDNALTVYLPTHFPDDHQTSAEIRSQAIAMLGSEKRDRRED
ncbi:hypothetical protein [Burkholderia stagnalis]|uniref:hypothetical protein n=1 Tax=Burkholderia stagnalis TaxID=1503054 RepID=UPI000AE6CE69|nr:hypothetical protein [Burkholderia stagnalis]